MTLLLLQMKREKAVKRKEALEHAKREEEEARLAEVGHFKDELSSGRRHCSLFSVQCSV